MVCEALPWKPASKSDFSTDAELNKVSFDYHNVNLQNISYT